MDKIDEIYKQQREDIEKVFKVENSKLDRFNRLAMIVFSVLLIFCFYMIALNLSRTYPEGTVGIRVGNGGGFFGAQKYYSNDYLINTDGTLTINSYYNWPIIGKEYVVSKPIITNQWTIEGP
jgi:hypothetical protein